MKKILTTMVALFALSNTSVAVKEEEIKNFFKKFAYKSIDDDVTNSLCELMGTLKFEGAKFELISMAPYSHKFEIDQKNDASSSPLVKADGSTISIKGPIKPYTRNCCYPMFDFLQFAKVHKLQVCIEPWYKDKTIKITVVASSSVSYDLTINDFNIEK